MMEELRGFLQETKAKYDNKSKQTTTKYFN